MGINVNIPIGSKVAAYLNINSVPAMHLASDGRKLRADVLFGAYEFEGDEEPIKLLRRTVELSDEARDAILTKLYVETSDAGMFPDSTPALDEPTETSADTTADAADTTTAEAATEEGA